MTSRIPHRILVVDDEPIMLALLSDLLSGEGYQVSLAESAFEALRLIQNDSFHLIISDINMPMMDGKQLYMEVARLSLNIPFVFMTGGITGQSDVRMLETASCPIRRFLIKPFTPEELFDALGHRRE